MSKRSPRDEYLDAVRDDEFMEGRRTDDDWDLIYENAERHAEQEHMRGSGPTPPDPAIDEDGRLGERASALYERYQEWQEHYCDAASDAAIQFAEPVDRRSFVAAMIDYLDIGFDEDLPDPEGDPDELAAMFEAEVGVRLDPGDPRDGYMVSNDWLPPQWTFVHADGRPWDNVRDGPTRRKRVSKAASAADQPPPPPTRGERMSKAAKEAASTTDQWMRTFLTAASVANVLEKVYDKATHAADKRRVRDLLFRDPNAGVLKATSKARKKAVKMIKAGESKDDIIALLHGVQARKDGHVAELKARMAELADKPEARPIVLLGEAALERLALRRQLFMAFDRELAVQDAVVTENARHAKIINAMTRWRWGREFVDCENERHDEHLELIRDESGGRGAVAETVNNIAFKASMTMHSVSSFLTRLRPAWTYSLDSDALKRVLAKQCREQTATVVEGGIKCDWPEKWLIRAVKEQHVSFGWPSCVSLFMENRDYAARTLAMIKAGDDQDAINKARVRHAEQLCEILASISDAVVQDADAVVQDAVATERSHHDRFIKAMIKRGYDEQAINTESQRHAAYLPQLEADIAKAQDGFYGDYGNVKFQLEIAELANPARTAQGAAA